MRRSGSDFPPSAAVATAVNADGAGSPIGTSGAHDTSSCISSCVNDMSLVSIIDSFTSA
jgi:hypothetical protein